jgi:hypothetical protein
MSPFMYAGMHHAVRLCSLPLLAGVGFRRVCIRLLVMCSAIDAGKRELKVTSVLVDALPSSRVAGEVMVQ